MKYAALALKLLVLSYLAYLIFFLATDYEPALSGYSPPFIIFVIDTINFFIHEAGHFFLKPFGMWIHIIGGTLFQVLIPLSLLIVTWRQDIRQIGYPGFWLGESLINVSVYIKDAPVRQLKLIARGLIHDWNWLLSGNLESAEPLGQLLFVVGLLLCVGSVGAGVAFAVQNFRAGVKQLG
jgi:hypothetical protein